MNIDKYINESRRKSRNSQIKVLIAGLILIVCISVLVNKMVIEIKEEGLKNILNTVWEGEK